MTGKRKNETKIILIQETARKAIRHETRLWSSRNVCFGDMYTRKKKNFSKSAI